MGPEDTEEIENASLQTDGNPEHDIEQGSLKSRKRLGSSSYKDLGQDSPSTSYRDSKLDRDSLDDQSSRTWFGWKQGRSSSRLQRMSFLVRGFAMLVGLLIAFHAASCGYFFCAEFPGTHVLGFSKDLYEDFRDIYALAGGPHVRRPEIIRNGAQYQDPTPKLIPKVLHQTYSSKSNLSPAIRDLMLSWQDANPDWSFRFYDDESCLEFVSREFPEYLSAYKGLAKDVERADFFRYMVILRLGGVYADVDTECRKPMNEVIRPHDTLVVSWENEFSTAEEARSRKYVRKRQILQWVFAGAPGHPALREICDTIARTVEDPIDNDTNLDTLERTGPGLWTDKVLKHAMLHPPSKKSDPWNVRIMPKVVFGVHPLNYDGLSSDDPEIVVMHHFLGSWKSRSLGLRKRLIKFQQWIASFFTPQPKKPVMPPAPRLQGMEIALPRDRATKQLYPVDIRWAPHFTMLVDLVGHGDVQSGSDVSAALTAYGIWQPALLPHKRPSVGDALIGSLSGEGAEKRVFVDIGAGNGLFSMMAASRGHQVIAFEMSKTSVASFNASLVYNGFQKLVQIHEVALGHEDQVICLDADPSSAHETSMDLVHLGKGYGHPAVHQNLVECIHKARRKPAHSLIPSDTAVGSIRISVSGWEGWVWEGLKDVIERSKPDVILVELHPSLMAEMGFEGGALRLLQGIHQKGYGHVSHSGFVCEERWTEITRSIRMKGGSTDGNLEQPTWCQLLPDQYTDIIRRASTKYPENILFTRQTAEGATQAVQRAQTEQDSPSEEGEDILEGVQESGDSAELDKGPRIDRSSRRKHHREGRLSMRGNNS